MPKDLTNTDLLQLTKDYLVSKLEVLYNTNRDKLKNYDIKNYKENILSSSTIDELKKSCNLARKDGLTSYTKYITGVTRFYSYLVANDNVLNNVDGDLARNYKDSLDMKEGTKKNYIEVFKEFLRFVEIDLDDAVTSSIDEVNVKRPLKEVKPSLTGEQYKIFNEAITRYPYASECIANRDILILRFILLCGLTAKDLNSLELGKNLLLNENTYYLDLENRVNVFNLPNKYFQLELVNYISNMKMDNKKLFNEVSTKYINDLIASVLKFANIDTKEKDIKMLITSFAVYLYNKRKDNKQISIKHIQELLGHARQSETKRMIGFHDEDNTLITDLLNNYL